MFVERCGKNDLLGEDVQRSSPSVLVWTLVGYKYFAPTGAMICQTLMRLPLVA